MKSPAALTPPWQSRSLPRLRQELEAEGWGWIEVNPEREWDLINRCSRIQPRLMAAPAELLAEHEQAKAAELEAIENALEDTESEELIEQQEAACDRLDKVQEERFRFMWASDSRSKIAGR